MYRCLECTWREIWLPNPKYCGRLFRVPINSKEFETRIKQVLVLISMCISVREGEATKLKLVPSTSGSNRALSPMPKAAQANNHIDKKRSAIPRNNLVPIAIRTEAPVNRIQVQQLLLVLLVLGFSDGLLMKSVPY
ncbi:hypothetical protein DAPPUDRAFT_271615 [Daphnia pulex]|uniref:Uncharacterized protein n=1 Tax=Daphnia pulex TaxID=6669 RepID=E9I2B1_DAPPU|nr:hypothetical protein DAPPUDRAFT_271615 [Daphnia pulex]|eukprot:EFX61869.1 hypothetical protein DAPPUDRAFT_271615 [Daphnia pulex]